MPCHYDFSHKERYAKWVTECLTDKMQAVQINGQYIWNICLYDQRLIDNDYCYYIIQIGINRDNRESNYEVFSSGNDIVIGNWNSRPGCK